jgi:hypothetical protein
MSDHPERRSNDALRRRVDDLLGRVNDARAEIVERGLDAVRGPDPGERDEGGVEPPADGGPKPAADDRPAAADGPGPTR